VPAPATASSDPTGRQRGRSVGAGLRRAAALGLVLGLAGCGRFGAGAAAGGGLDIAFADVEAPEAFASTGAVLVDGGDGAPGFWAAVPGLDRPERALARRAEVDGGGVVVALFRGGGGGARLSAEAGAALGLAPGETAELAIVALRREPQIIGP
jgi:hypothetical protein